MNERFFLIDCGEGTQMQLRKFRLSPARISHIFISHLHGDHVFGLFGLLSSLGLMGRRAGVHLYGPAALQDMMEGHLRFFGPLPFELSIHRCDHGSVIYQDSKTEVLSLRLNHRTETFGYLFREKPRLLNLEKSAIDKYSLGVEQIRRIKEGMDHVTSEGLVVPNSALTMPPFRQRTYAYISDTKYMEKLHEWITGVDLLYHEATFLEEDRRLAEQTFHSTARQAAMVAEAAGAEKLLIGHFSTRYRDEQIFVDEARSIFPATIAVNDGDRFVIERRRQMHS